MEKRRGLRLYGHLLKYSYVTPHKSSKLQMEEKICVVIIIILTILYKPIGIQNLFVTGYFCLYFHIWLLIYYKVLPIAGRIQNLHHRAQHK